MRSWAAFILVLFCADSRADKVDDFVQAEMEKRQIPGLALTVIRAGEDSKSAAYGFANLELRSPARLETVFEIGSLTKQFTAACVLLLAQDGKLSVDDKISRYLSEIPAAWSNITIRHLLNHTSGIKSYTGLAGFELTKHLNHQQFIAALSSFPLEFAPGEQWKYCNSGYNLLGFIIQNVSGRNYWSFLAERILGSVSMSSTTNRDPIIVVRNRADGYKKTRNGLVNRDYDLTDVFSAGAIVSTVGDLTKWNAVIETDNLLNSSSKTQMWTPAKLNDGQDSHYGFGWRIDSFQGHKNIGHSGSTSGFSASLQRFPDDSLTVIVLCNSEESNVATTLARGIASLYFEPKSPN